MIRSALPPLALVALLLAPPGATRAQDLPVVRADSTSVDVRDPPSSSAAADGGGLSRRPIAI